MDPDVALRELREQYRYLETLPADNVTFMVNAACLVEKVRNLDEWLTNGGFLPADWMGLNR